MTQMLKDLGGPVPSSKSSATAPQAVGEGQVLCVRCHRSAPKLPKPPFKGPQGQEIFELC